MKTQIAKLRATPRVLCLILTMSCLAWSIQAGAELGDNSVGMNIHVGIPSHIAASQDLGVSWVRMDANWYQIETADDVHHWSSLDAWVAEANTAGLQVYLTLAYTPEWVARESGADSVFFNDAPQTATEWTDFVRDTVSRYCPLGVTHYGIWNEPNLSQFWEGSLEQYVDRILIPGAAAVRDACQACGGTCKVLGPDIANVGDCDVYLEGVLARAGANTFDIIAHHTYQDFAETGWVLWNGDGFINVLDDQRLPGYTRKDLRQILDAAGYSGEVWITETGYRAHPVGDSEEEAMQAIYVRRVLEEQLGRAWYTNSFFYEISDCGVDQPDCDIDGYGLMRALSAGDP
ncbi:MAG: hypothetical protein JRF33_21355, partial [Deltaproteobacteria bacterium]|nr:hypothetical protein [Deltaproteobacteria bacterium]